MALENLILWKPLQKTTILLYAGVLLLALPAPKIATLLLFGLVALWSRIPAMMTMFTKDVEVVDFFTVIIALNMGPFIGGIFGTGLILFSRIFGPAEDIDYTLKESICFFVGAFFSYGVFHWTGANVMITMFSFTFIRYAFYLVLDLVTTPNKVFLTLIILAISAPIAVISNLLWVNLFGDALNRIFEKGAVVSWELLVFVTGAILVFFFASKFLFREEQKRVEARGGDDGGDDFATSLLAVPEPHEALFSVLTLPELGSFFYITPALFQGFMTVSFFVLILVASFQQKISMSVLQMVVVFVGVYCLIRGITWFLERFLQKNPQ